MRFTFCLLFAMPLMLSVFAESDQKVRRRTLEDSQSPAENLLQDASPKQTNNQTAERHLTWGWSWNKKKTRKSKQHRFKERPCTNIATTAAACDCKDRWKSLKLTGFIGNAIEPTPSVNQIGGQYIYNSQLSRNEALTEPFDNGTAAFITGACSRFQNLEITPNGNRILGAGVCQFVLSVDTPNESGSMILQGELFDVIPSTVAITGGTDEFDGARGTVTFSPFYEDTENDIFTQAVHVELAVDARMLDDDAVL